jgi:hypothetical protein
VVWPAAHGAEQTIVVVGDSLSSGYGIAAEQSWVAMLEDRLRSEGYGYQVVNASIAGDTSSGGLARLPRLLAAHDPQLVVIELGGNDGLRGQPVATLRDNLAKMIELSHQRSRRRLAGIKCRRTTPDLQPSARCRVPRLAERSRAADRVHPPDVALNRDSCSPTASSKRRGPENRVRQRLARARPLLMPRDAG